MGAENVTMVIKGGNKTHVKRKIAERCADEQHESGHGGYVVALKAKGKAKRDTTGFVVDVPND